MSVSHPEFTALIQGPPALIFDLVADMPNYHRWLPGSDAFGGTTCVEPYPVRLGTTYLDAGPLGERPGEVIEFDPPHRLGFHHTMSIRQGPIRAAVDVRVRYLLDQQGSATFVRRTLDLTIEMPWWQRIARPLLIHAFRKENLRIMAELKRYVESASS